MDTGQFLQLLKNWHDFYVMIGAAAATLLGLLFVALSLNSDLVLSAEAPQLRYIVEQAFRNYVAMLLLSAQMLAPFESGVEFGRTLALGTTVMTVFSAYRLYAAIRSTARQQGRIQMQHRIVPALLAFCMMFAGGLALMGALSSSVPPMTLIGIAAIILMISATETAWDLLVQLGAERHRRTPL